MKTLWCGMLLVLAGLVACSGDTGPVGPKGDKGNANVKSGSITPTDAEWLWNSSYSLRTGTGTTTSYFTRYVNIAVAQIDSTIIDNGAVLVFMEPIPGSGRWVPLNYTFLAFGGGYFLNYVYEAMVGNIRLHFFLTENTSAPPSPQTFVLAPLSFRYVVIAGTALQLIQNGEANVDLNDYESVKAFADSYSGTKPSSNPGL